MAADGGGRFTPSDTPPYLPAPSNAANYGDAAFWDDYFEGMQDKLASATLRLAVPSLFFPDHYLRDADGNIVEGRRPRARLPPSPAQPPARLRPGRRRPCHWPPSLPPHPT